MNDRQNQASNNSQKINQSINFCALRCQWFNVFCGKHWQFLLSLTFVAANVHIKIILAKMSMIVTVLCVQNNLAKSNADKSSLSNLIWNHNIWTHCSSELAMSAAISGWRAQKLQCNARKEKPCSRKIPHQKGWLGFPKTKSWTSHLMWSHEGGARRAESTRCVVVGVVGDRHTVSRQNRDDRRRYILPAKEREHTSKS